MPTRSPSPGLVHDRAGRYQATRSYLREDEILAAAEDIVQRRFVRRGRLDSSADTKQFLRSKLVVRDREVFAVIFLDQRHRVIRYQELFHGTIDGAQVHSRIVVQRALQLNAAAVVFGHNHPSGLAQPSCADREITARLIKALGLVEVRVLDHIVVGADETVSFADRGWL